MYNTDRSTTNYVWYFSNLMGVGRYHRRTDGAMTRMYTGKACDEERMIIESLSDEDFDRRAEGNVFYDEDGLVAA